MKTQHKTELKVYESPLVEVISLRLTSSFLADSKGTEQFERVDLEEE